MTNSDDEDFATRAAKNRLAAQKADQEAALAIRNMQNKRGGELLNSRRKNDAEIAKKRLDSWKKPY